MEDDGDALAMEVCSPMTGPNIPYRSVLATNDQCLVGRKGAWCAIQSVIQR
jgi:hypothetical protein